MKEQLLIWIKKNIKYFIMFFVAVLLVSVIGIKQCQVKHLTEKINSLEVTNFGLNQDRQTLELLLKGLQNEYDKIENSNDSLKGVLAKYQLELILLKKKHQKEIDSLLNVNIPNDTVYNRLGLIYPNFDGTILEYPFSGSQIRKIYSTAISYPMIQQEYTLQGKSLNTCLILNKGYETGIVNLNSQIVNLQDNINKADLQIKNYDKEVGILKRQISRKGFWNKAMIVATGVAVGIAVLK